MPLASTMASREGFEQTQVSPRTAPPFPGSLFLLELAACTGSSKLITGVAVAISHTTTRPSLSPDARLRNTRYPIVKEEVDIECAADLALCSTDRNCMQPCSTFGEWPTVKQVHSSCPWSGILDTCKVREGALSIIEAVQTL